MVCWGKRSPHLTIMSTFDTLFHYILDLFNHRYQQTYFSWMEKFFFPLDGDGVLGEEVPPLDIYNTFPKWKSFFFTFPRWRWGVGGRDPPTFQHRRPWGSGPPCPRGSHPRWMSHSCWTSASGRQTGRRAGPCSWGKKKQFFFLFVQKRKKNNKKPAKLRISKTCNSEFVSAKNNHFPKYKNNKK